MAKVYNNKWKVKKLSINFNHKQWRQDFGAFVKSKFFWDGTTMVTRSKSTNNGVNISSKGEKQFTVYNAHGGEVKVVYKNENEILYTNQEELVKEYFEERGMQYGR